MPRQPDLPANAIAATLSRLLPTASHFTRTSSGVSSQMYQVESGDALLYLRIDEEDLTVDAMAQERMLLLGAKVPEVVAVEASAEELDRSVLLMREIPGVPLAEISDPDVANRAARAAGRDAALINSFEVDGFGWIDRQKPAAWAPTGPISDYSSFASEFIPDAVEERHALLEGLFDKDELDALDRIVSRQQQRRLVRGTLSHGDLDVTAIYVDGDEYSGIIDFGELRGGEPEFDLAHFMLHDQETNPVTLFDSFSAGHAEVSGTATAIDLVRRVAILVGLRQLCHFEGRGTPRSFLTHFRAAQLLNLLEGKPACRPRVI